MEQYTVLFVWHIVVEICWLLARGGNKQQLMSFYTGEESDFHNYR